MRGKTPTFGVRFDIKQIAIHFIGNDLHNNGEKTITSLVRCIFRLTDTHFLIDFSKSASKSVCGGHFTSLIPTNKQVLAIILALDYGISWHNAQRECGFTTKKENNYDSHPKNGTKQIKNDSII